MCVLSTVRSHSITVSERHIDKIELALAIYMVLAWRLAYLVLLGRTHPDLSAGNLFSKVEWKGAYILAEKRRPAHSRSCVR